MEEICLSILERVKSGPISVEELFSKTAGKGRYFILILFSLPFCFGITLPGFSIPFGVAIMLVGFRMAFGQRVWIPHFLKNKKISASALKKIFTKSLWLARKMKALLKSRFQFFKNRFAIAFHGILVVLLGFILALPLPIPFTNIIVAWPIFLISLGYLQNDGLCILLGDFLVLLCLILSTLVYKEILILALRIV